jgi:hypothetical protein
MTSTYLTHTHTAVDNDKSKLLFYNNLNATLLFLPLIAMFETQVCSRLYSIRFYIVSDYIVSDYIEYPII